MEIIFAFKFLGNCIVIRNTVIYLGLIYVALEQEKLH